MEDFRYKEYTEEESRMYHNAMDRIMEALQRGMNFHDACRTANVGDEELKRFIEDDALKIMIADMHFKKGFSLEETADALKVPVDVVSKANAEMLEDISISSAEVFKSANPDAQFGNA
jgi:hypothetical protein